MSSIKRIFEVRIKANGQFRTLHFPATSHKQAAKKVGKNSKILSVRKADSSKILGDIEKLQLVQGERGVYLGGGLYERDINLDEILGLRKSERRKRRSNDKRDKQQ